MDHKVILYAEDEEDDALLLQLAFKRVGITHALQVVDDGEATIAYLSGTGEFADRSRYPLPTLVLLDLNLPRISGFKVLEWIRKHPHFSSLPVVVYTSSEQTQDLKMAEELGANDYMVKPALIEQIAERVRELKTRWLEKA